MDVEVDSDEVEIAVEETDSDGIDSADTDSVAVAGENEEAFDVEDSERTEVAVEEQKVLNLRELSNQLNLSLSLRLSSGSLCSNFQKEQTLRKQLLGLELLGLHRRVKRGKHSIM